MMIIIMMNTEAVNKKGERFFRLKSLHFFFKSIQLNWKKGSWLEKELLFFISF